MTAPATGTTEPAGGAPPAPVAGDPPVGGAPAVEGGNGGRFDMNTVADGMINERGGGYQGAREALRKVLWDNSKLRSRARSLKERTVEDGAVVLRGDDLTTYNRYKGLGLSPDQIKEKMDQYTVLQDKVKATDQEKFFDSIAESMGFSASGKKVFTKIAKMSGIEVEVRDVVVEKTDGTKATEKKPFARIAGDAKAEWKALDVYLDEEHKEFRPALYADDTDGSGSPGAGTEHANERKVTPMPTQSSSTPTPANAKERAAVQSVLNSRYGSNAAKK